MADEADRMSGFCMSPGRAEEIRMAIKAARGWGQVGVCPTKDEDREITRFWNTLPSGTSYYDAVTRMAKGEHLNEEGGK